MTILKGAPWRFAAPLSVFVAVFLALWSLRATVFFTVDEQIASPVWRAAYADLLKLVVWVLPAAVFVARLRKASPARYLGISVAPGPRVWSLCLLVTASFLMLVAIAETSLGGKSISAVGLRSLPAALLLLQFVLSPLLEEILFRGLLMKELLVLLPAWLASGVNSLLFVAVHLPYWLYHGGATQAMAANAIGVFLFSLLACWLFARSASIWPPVVAHIANNLLSTSLVTAA
ncbi:MAG: CPBP family intramembrane metalloprotease [Burkholderiales bacterium]|nr:CPBP family intramembrane metalloprotease [Burkholderiales bacterium]